MTIYVFEINEFTASCEYRGKFDSRRALRSAGLSVLTQPQHSLYHVEGAAIVEAWSELDQKGIVEVCVK